jgi:hypothetical protein
MPSFATVDYDPTRDLVHIRYVAASLATEADVAAFGIEIETQVRAIDRKVDTIVGLGTMLIAAGAIHAYDEIRTHLATTYSMRSYRYGGTAALRRKILTSCILQGQPANLYDTFDQALAALMADRESPG